ncbi:MAG: Gfo/Idh/MocA family oxidoreductase, partial [Oscillospiraceae bacterium]|nr:Gfo/Idh/MocA family oxidoreductase [Oscillospiraceae bacterium]
TFLHCDTTIKALESGFNVICEKPMALNYEDCLKMCEAAKRTGKLFMVAQCVRWSNIVQAAKKYMAEGTFGKVKTACFKRDGGPPKWGWENWFNKEELSGGALLDMHVHDLDALQYLFGVPESVSTGAGRIFPEVGYDIVCTNYYYKDGLFTHSTTDWSTDNNIYYNNTMRVDFIKGYLISASFGGQYIFRAMGTDGSSVDLIPEYGGDNFYYKEVKYFVDCLLAGEPVTECTPESTAESIRIALTEGVSASKNGERIYL